jgi:hypothetical protein
LKIEFSGTYWGQPFGVTYNYLGLRSAYYEIHPIVIRHEAQINYKTFGILIVNNNTASGQDVLQFVSLKINGNPVDISYISVLETEPTYIHKNGKLTYDTMNGVMYLNKA